MANRWGNSGNSNRLNLGGSKITVDDDCSHEIKRCLPHARKAMINLDSILRSRDITLSTKVHLVKAMVFPSNHIWVWELDHKECWAPKNWCFQTVVLEKTLESPLDSKESKPVNPKGNQPWQYFVHLMQRSDSLEKTLMLGKIEDKRRRYSSIELHMRRTVKNEFYSMQI